MKKQVWNENQEFIANIELADHFWLRFKGLLGQKSLEPYNGLMIKPCQQVHTIGMRFPISVWFLDHYNCILRIIDDLQPYKISPKVKNCSYVLEFPQNWAEEIKIKEGDYIILGQGDRHFVPSNS